jgi:CubicO group peptidase (beta-lactamase class C family)
MRHERGGRSTTRARAMVADVPPFRRYWSGQRDGRRCEAVRAARPNTAEKPATKYSYKSWNYIAAALCYTCSPLQIKD